jgi:hypothetical protein
MKIAIAIRKSLTRVAGRAGPIRDWLVYDRTSGEALRVLKSEPDAP